MPDYCRIVGAGALSMLMASLALAQPERPEEIQQSEPGFLVRVDVDHATRRYRAGDTLRVTAVSEEDAYLYLLYRQADGRVYQIYPNSAQPDNRVKARQPVRVPAGDDLFSWRIGPPYGEEAITAIASKKPLAELSDPEFLKRRFSPVDSENVKGIALELGEEPPAKWAEHTVPLTTYQSNVPVEPGKKRIGVFFGVGVHANAFVSPWKMDLNTTARDANNMAELMGDAGDLDLVKVYNNQQATRAQLEETMTEWLPKVSRPGDTVFFYYTGHAGQVPDNNKDEPDGQDEVLVTHDFADASIFARLVEMKKEGKLQGSNAREFVRLAKLAAGAKTVEEVQQKLVRATGVSDDLFGHWLQKLDGRKIVVILDTCHSGGFATNEKGLSPSQATAFLDVEFGRLKDIGQRQCAVLAASSASRSAYPRADGDDFPNGRGPLSVFTSYLVEAMLNASGSLSLEDAHQHAQRGMAEFFKDHRDIEHKPQLRNNLSETIYFKR